MAISQHDNHSMSLSILLILTALPPLAGADSEKPLEGKVACVYPVSGQYGAISRWVYYALLLFGICAQREVWLIAGALATAMSYSATAALHALLLACSTARQPVFDLDLAGTWAVLSAGLFALWPVLGTSRTLIESPFRPIFSAWGIMVAIGIIASVCPVYLTYDKEPQCLSSTGALLQHPYQVGMTEWNCSYSCFDSNRILRAPSEIQAIDARTIYGDYWGLFKALAAYSANASVIIIIITSGLGLRWHRWSQRRKARKNPSIDVNDCSRMTFNPLHPRDRSERWAAFFFFVNQGTSIAAVVLTEIYLLGGGLPMDEQPFNVSQWGGAVAVALVIIAAGINKYFMWRASQTAPLDPEALPNSQAATSPEAAVIEPKEESDTAVVQARSTFSRVPTLPIREVRMGFWDKLRDFIQYLRTSPQDLPLPQPRPQPRSAPGFISFRSRPGQ